MKLSSLTDQWICLLPSVAEVSAESEVTRVLFSPHTVSSSHWEAEVGDGDIDMNEDLELPKIAVNPSNLCQQFSSELKKKFEVRQTNTHTHSHTPNRHLNIQQGNREY